ncbi:hypothetical protein HPB48_014296 [Haemaphysalis longicornis]|uniref:Calponin-homology (CH) domain-containing protein n=1 Tax=Haemaphysalis longicornis TaxID=44386 RepID=A0A9J6FIP1_HAELO|nr:hypothetical protein HPB48_014296 [Haemaphysalis longicornis]
MAGSSRGTRASTSSPHGVAYCQLIDQLHPGTLPMSRVRMDATLSFEKANNFTLLNQAFKKAGLPIDICIERLIAGRFRDHFELSKWLKRVTDERQLDSACQTAPRSQLRDDQGSSTHRSLREVTPGTTTPRTQRACRDQSTGPEPRSEVDYLKERVKTLIQERDKIRATLTSIAKMCSHWKSEGTVETSVTSDILEVIRQSELEVFASREDSEDLVTKEE